MNREADKGFMLPTSRENWAIVLAAGDGTRLRAITVDRNGKAVPKQYCTLRGGRTLLGDALERARRVASPERVVVVVAAQHWEWWDQELASIPPNNVIVQPENRGTASGILLPLLSILERDSAARVAFFPSDHFVRDEQVLERAVRAALNELADDELVLLGIKPGYAETQYGWIVPAHDGSARVARFVEKPGAVEAKLCMREGGAWNSFLFAAKGTALLRLYEACVPTLLAAFRHVYRADSSERPRALLDVYANLDSVDFSRAVLEQSVSALRLQIVPACGWTDLGTPERVARCLDDHRPRCSQPASRSRTSPDLSVALVGAGNHTPSGVEPQHEEIRS